MGSPIQHSGFRKIHQDWDVTRGHRIHGSFRVREAFPEADNGQRVLAANVDLNVMAGAPVASDFFPVILNFLRQVPFIGTFLSLPYIRQVRPVDHGRSPLSFAQNLTKKPRRRGCLSHLDLSQIADRIAGVRQSAV
jgi:hypothetical protein